MLGIMTVLQYLKYSSDSDSDQHEQTTEVIKLLNILCSPSSVDEDLTLKNHYNLKCSAIGNISEGCETAPAQLPLQDDRGQTGS